MRATNSLSQFPVFATQNAPLVLELEDKMNESIFTPTSALCTVYVWREVAQEWLWLGDSNNALFLTTAIMAHYKQYPHIEETSTGSIFSAPDSAFRFQLVTTPTDAARLAIQAVTA